MTGGKEAWPAQKRQPCVDMSMERFFGLALSLVLSFRY